LRLSSVRFRGNIFEFGASLIFTSGGGQTWQPLDFLGDFDGEGVRDSRRYSTAIGFHAFANPNPSKSFTLVVANSVMPKARSERAVRMS
jgi:hypothetical protein